MAGTAAVEILELSLPARTQADEAPHQADLPNLDGEDLGARPRGASGSQYDRRAQAAGQDPRRDQLSSVVRAQDPRLNRGLERADGRGGPQLGYPAGVGELKHLGAPLHVTEPTGAELEVAGRVNAPWQALGLSAAIGLVLGLLISRR